MAAPACPRLAFCALAGLAHGAGGAGLPLPGPTLRELAQQRGILFGTDIQDTWPRPYVTEAEYADCAHRQFDFANWDWCTSWKVNQPSGPAQQYDFSCFDAVAEFMRAGNMSARTNGILVSAHNMLAPIDTSLPQWLLDGYQNISLSEAQIQGFLHQRIETVVPHWLTAGVPIRGLIAVNEAFWNQEMPAYGEWPHNWVFGPKENMFSWAWGNGTGWFAQTFQWARKAADDAGFARDEVRLLYNDYSIETPTAKADAVLRFLKEQIAAGVPIDGVGFQAHMRCDCQGYPVQPGCNDSSVIQANMQRFIDLGLSVWVTELDVAMAPGCTQQMQADVYRAVLQACLDSRPRCDSVMLWGFTDRYTWLDNATQAPNILDADYAPKPAFFALQQALAGDDGRR